MDPLEVAVEDRLEEGLRAIEEQATALMREIAAEMWRASGADVSGEQARILNLLSKDQSIRSLIASSDERFQSIALRTARLEDSLAELAESSRHVREAIQLSARSIHEIAASPTLQGVERVRTQLEQVEQHIAATFEHLNERDRTLTESIEQQVAEHGRLIEREAERVVEALREHVPPSEGAATAEGDQAGGGDTAQRLELLYERVDIQRRALAELQVALERMVETRTLGLAQLVRSDSQTLRRLIEERSESQEASIRGAVEERLEAISAAGEEQAATLARTTEEQVSALTLAVSSAIERSFSRLSTEMDDRMEALVESRLAADDRIDERFGEQLDERLTALAKLIRSDNRVLANRISETAAGTSDGEIAKQTLRAVKELQAGLGTSPDVVEGVDRRFQVMAEQLHKESQSTAEAMVKVAEVLGGKIDRLSVQVDEGYGNDLQIVIDRMSDAIQAMSGRSRRDTGRYDTE